MKVEVFRGEHGSSPLQSRLASVSFVDSAAVAAYYAVAPNDRRDADEATTPRLLHCQVSIINPLTNAGDDAFIDYEVLEAKVGRDCAIGLMARHADHIKATSAWEEGFAEQYDSVEALIRAEPERLNELYLQIWPVLDDPQSVADLKQVGVDGAVYRGSGMSMNAVEYRVFSLDQIQTLATYHAPSVAALPAAAVLDGLVLNLSDLVPVSTANKPRGPRPR